MTTPCAARFAAAQSFGIRQSGTGKRFRYGHKSGFTLVEVLAALVLIAIVLPAAMRGITIATEVAGSTRHRTEAAGLAQAKLTELIATGTWMDGPGSGDFGTDAPGYTWTSDTAAWDEDGTSAGLERVDVRVSWLVRGREQFVVLSTLVRSSQ